jgi:hypothetical protein
LHSPDQLRGITDAPTRQESELKDIAATSYSVDAIDPVAKSKLEKGKQGIMKER